MRYLSYSTNAVKSSFPALNGEMLGKGTLIIYFLSLWTCSAFAQMTMYIPPTGRVFLHPSDSVAIFGNVRNEGSIGSEQGAVVDFEGAFWSNAPASSLPGKSKEKATGGLFRFTGSETQMLAAGYSLESKSGPSFPNISIENEEGVRLVDINDLHIRGQLQLKKGHLFLNKNNILVDKSITNFSPEKFVVTGREIGTGSLYRQPSVEDSILVYPIGTDVDSYSPVGLKLDNLSIAWVGVRVFDHVLRHAVKGEIMDNEFVKKTWELHLNEGNPGGTVMLQYREADEGKGFSSLRDSSYISRYNIQGKKWDKDHLPHAVSASSIFTSGTGRKGFWINDRYFPEGIGNDAATSTNWYSVSTKKHSEVACPVADFKLWAAQRYNYKWVQLFWRTRTELNVQAYELQRRAEGNELFQTVAVVDAQSDNPSTKGLSYYYYSDKNISGVRTAYRLKLVGFGGCIAYTDVKEVSYSIKIEVWPNPARGKARVQVKGVVHPIVMRLTNLSGRVLRTYKINGDGIIALENLPPATYILSFYDPEKEDSKIKSVKLVVQ